MFEEQMRMIQAMPDGPQKEMMLQRLYQDYKGQGKTDALQYGQGTQMMAGAQMPEGIRVGSGKNQQFIGATGMSGLASGLKYGLGAIQQDRALRSMRGSSDDKSQGLMDSMKGFLGGNRGGGATAPPPDAEMGGAVPPDAGLPPDTGGGQSVDMIDMPPAQGGQQPVAANLLPQPQQPPLEKSGSKWLTDEEWANPWGIF